MISKINWKTLKLTEADGNTHQLGETIFRHIPADKFHCAHIIARLHNRIWTCYKNAPFNLGWSRPFPTVGQV